MKSAAARWIGRGMRAVVFGALVIWLARRLDWTQLREGLYVAATHPLGIAAGVLLMLLTSLAAALRWRGLLAAQAVTLPAGRVMSIFFIGQFFNSFMLGACGGDMARIYYVLRDTTARRTETATSVLIDRGIGVFVQVLLGCLLILVEWPHFRADGTLRTVALLMLATGAGAALAAAALLWTNVFERFALLRRLVATVPLGTRIRRAYEEFFCYRRRLRALAAAVFYSVLNLLFQVAATACLGSSIGITADFSSYLVFLPIISVLTAIPLTPGSFGVREGLFVLLFQTVGVDAHQAVLLSLLYYAAALVWNLAGGIVFLGFSAGAGLNLREELAHIRHSRDEDATPPAAAP
jgi:uncharacterized protein (TIRG00374 family)